MIVLSRWPDALEKADETRELAVGVIEHAGEGRLQSRKEAALVGGMLVPGLYAVVAGRQRVCRRARCPSRAAG